MNHHDEIDHDEHAEQTVEQEREQAAELCECFDVDPKYWTVTPYGTEPGSTMEWNPDCPVHPPHSPTSPSESLGDG